MEIIFDASPQRMMILILFILMADFDDSAIRRQMISRRFLKGAMAVILKYGVISCALYK